MAPPTANPSGSLNPELATAWAIEWSEKYSDRWQLSPRRTRAGAQVYVLRQPLAPIQLDSPGPSTPQPRPLPEDNLSVRAIRELELQLKETT